MRRIATVSGITSGILAASATLGALIGFGIRLGAPARVFNAIGAIVVGRSALAYTGFAPAVTLIGVVVHVLAMLACGAVYARLVEWTRGSTIAWAFGVSTAACTLTWLFARWFGVGPAVLLPFGNMIVLTVLLALALPIGMRFALLWVYKD